MRIQERLPQFTAERSLDRASEQAYHMVANKNTQSDEQGSIIAQQQEALAHGRYCSRSNPCYCCDYYFGRLIACGWRC
jgi:hypothetical protein